MVKSLRTFVEDLETNYPEEIIRIAKGPLNPAEGECVAILHQLMEMGKRPMAVFENVITLRGERWPGSVAFQLGGTWTKIGAGYGLPYEQSSYIEIQEETVRRTQQRIPPVLIDTAEAPVKQLVINNGQASFLDLPGYIACEGDARPGNITGVVVAKDPETGRYNLSWHRVRIMNDHTANIALETKDRHLMWIVDKYRKMGKKQVPIAQVFGHHVLVGLAAAVRPGLDIDEFDFAGGILGEPLRVTPSTTWGEELLIPADAEVVIEGYISVDETAQSGLWADHLRYYIPDKPHPVYHLVAINMRQDPIFEHTWVGQYVYSDVAHSSFVRNMLKMKFPAIGTINIAAPFVMIIQYTPQYEGEIPRLVGMAYAYGDVVKHIVIVDHDIDPFDLGQVMWAIGSRVNAAEKTLVMKDLSPTGVDPMSYGAEGRKQLVSGFVIDATKPVGGPFPEVGHPSEEVLQRIKWQDYLPEEAVARLTTGATTRSWAKV